MIKVYLLWKKHTRGQKNDTRIKTTSVSGYVKAVLVKTLETSRMKCNQTEVYKLKDKVVPNEHRKILVKNHCRLDEGNCVFFLME